MSGCTNPAAKNYNPTADTDDGSCVYLHKVNDVCYSFEDYNQVVDKSFTLSQRNGRGWSFFHDYFPDFYVHTRNNTFVLNGNKVYKMNAGPRGKYHHIQPNYVYPFFVDIVFSDKNQMTLNAVNWDSEVRAIGNEPERNNSAVLYNETITSITIWNDTQCSGRILIADIEGLLQSKSAKTKNTWSLNDFRDVISITGVTFLAEIWQDFEINTSLADFDKPWYDKSLIESSFFVVRFEFDNNNDKQITIEDMDLSVSKSTR